MTNITRWTNRFVMERLSALCKTNEMSPGFEDRKNYNTKFADLVLSDGRGLDMQDPALALLSRFADPTGQGGVKNISKLMMYPCAIFRSEQPHHKDEAHLDLVDQIFALRQSGGWKEIDRLIAHIFDKTFSEFADEVTSRIHYSLDDPGLGGARIYQLEFLTPFSIPHVCFGSTASFATEHLMQTLLKVQQETKKTGVTPRAIRLCSGASRYFEVPLAHGLEDVCNPGNGEHPFQISFHLNWEGLSIGRKEHSVMLSLLKLAPKSEHNRIKGEFLEDELGL